MRARTAKMQRLVGTKARGARITIDMPLHRGTKIVLCVLLASACASSPDPLPAPDAVKAAPPPNSEADAETEEPTPWAYLLWWYKPDPYMLDHIPRSAVRDDRGKLECPDLEIVSYRGDAVRYHRGVRVNENFRERLRQFEEIVARVGEEVYGRAPSHIEHMGTQNCRVIRHRKHRLSEHALANAIDVGGFRFPAARGSVRDRAPEGLRGAFRVDVEDHWDAVKGRERHHAVFMKRLVEELWIERVFRGVIVPPARGHKDHLHLDMGRWRFFRGDISLAPEGRSPGG